MKHDPACLKASLRYREMETKPRGRPRELQGGRRVNVYLDQESLDRAEILGEGNLSLGVRRALKPED